MAKKIQDVTDFFVKGCDSRNKPYRLPPNTYVWGIDGIHRGGVFRTRPGFNEVLPPPTPGVLDDAYNPQGAIIFQGRNGQIYMVMAYRGNVFTSPYPFLLFTQLPNVGFYPFAKRVLFEVCERSQTTNKDGSLTLLPNPYNVLIMQDGFSPACYWDGINSGPLRRNVYGQNQTPMGQAMKFSNQRLWVAADNTLHASNFGDPFGFTDDQGTGDNQGFFTLDDTITCIGETPDLKALLVYTTDTTTTFQSGILSRFGDPTNGIPGWSLTPGFQQELFDNIGATGPLAFDNQYGISFWYSHNGLIQLDLALQTYRTRRLKYSDYGMSRSKAKLNKDLSGVVVKAHENFLLVSVPYANRHNTHTWLMDETTLESDDPEQRSGASWAGVWKGIRPVAIFGSVIKGVDRVFALSRDYGPIPRQYQIGIWEMFCNQRADTKLDGSVKRILCGFEAKKLLFGPDAKKISSIEVLAVEMLGQVDWSIYYNGLLTPAYKLAGTKTTISTEGSIGSPLQPVITKTTVIGNYQRQSRVIRTPEIHPTDSTIQSAQRSSTGPGIAQLDLAFGVYVQFVGDAGIDFIRVFADPQPEKDIGRPEPNETTARIVDWAGNETVTTTAPIPGVAHPSRSAFVDSFSQYFTEPFFSSR